MKPLTILAFVIVATVGSCKKENDPPPTNIEDLLCNKNWKIDETTFVQDNTLYHYKRGGSNNTHEFPNDAIFFEKGGTGTYTNTANEAFVINWQFTDSEKTEIQYTIHDYELGHPKPGVDLLVTWENVNVTSNSLKYAEIYTNANGVSIITSTKRIPL